MIGKRAVVYIRAGDWLGKRTMVNVPLMYPTSAGLIDKPLAVDYIEENYPGVDLTEFKKVAGELGVLYGRELAKTDLFNHVVMKYKKDKKIGTRYNCIVRLLTTYLHLPFGNTCKRIARKIDEQLPKEQKPERVPKPEPLLFFDTKANRTYYYACITGLYREEDDMSHDRKIKLNSENDLQRLTNCIPANPCTLQDTLGNDIVFKHCIIDTVTGDGTRLLRYAQFTAVTLLGRTGKYKKRKFKILKLRNVQQWAIQRSDFSEGFPDAQSKELVEFADNKKQMYLDVLNNKDVRMYRKKKYRAIRSE